MFEFEKICHRYEGLTYEERRNELNELAKDIYPALQILPDGLESFKLLIRAACAADGELQASEYTLVAAATGLDVGYENAEEAVNNTNSKALNELADVIVDVFGDLDPEIKEKMVKFMLCIVSADNRITLRESMLIKKLIK